MKDYKSWKMTTTLRRALRDYLTGPNGEIPLTVLEKLIPRAFVLGLTHAFDERYAARQFQASLQGRPDLHIGARDHVIESVMANPVTRDTIAETITRAQGQVRNSPDGIIIWAYQQGRQALSIM